MIAGLNSLVKISHVTIYCHWLKSEKLSKKSLTKKVMFNNLLTLTLYY